MRITRLAALALAAALTAAPPALAQDDTRPEWEGTLSGTPFSSGMTLSLDAKAGTNDKAVVAWAKFRCQSKLLVTGKEGDTIRFDVYGFYGPQCQSLGMGSAILTKSADSRTAEFTFVAAGKDPVTGTLTRPEK